MSQFGDSCSSVKSLLENNSNNIDCIMKVSCNLLEDIYSTERMVELLEYLEDTFKNNETISNAIYPYKEKYISYLDMYGDLE